MHKNTFSLQESFESKMSKQEEQNYLLILEELRKIANSFVPEGSNEEAMLHSWLHTFLYAPNLKLFPTTENIKKSISKVLDMKNAKYLRALYKNQILKVVFPPPKNIDFTFIDLFAGIGGMRLGFQEAGGLCVFSSEWDNHAQDTYFQNFGERPFGDITKINERDIPDHDVLIAGFPCQPFSHAGLKLGLEDTRGTLFFDIQRIIKTKRPKAFLLENVKGLKSHEKGRTFSIMLDLLNQIGYEITFEVLSSKDFGVPQNRQRIYIIGFRKDLNRKFIFSKPDYIPTKLSDILEGNVDSKFTITDKMWVGHRERKERNKKNGKGFGFSLFEPESIYVNTISARYWKDGSEILIAQKDKNPRTLTPREAARLQGFPDDFILNKSKKQAYKQFGNSVTVKVISYLAEKIKYSILN